MGVSRREDGPLREDTLHDASTSRSIDSSRESSREPEGGSERAGESERESEREREAGAVAGSAAARSAPKRLSVGDVVAERYVVERVVGLGGMGQVLAARHIKLGTTVAIKAVHPELANDSQAVARFLREAQAMARLASEHTVRVYDVGELAGGVPYMIMEHLEGRDLGALLVERGPLPVPLALEYVRQACDALIEAHAAGIIHRDVKPQNLFVTRRANGTELVRVLDFGLAKPMQNGAHQLTRAGCVIGTAQYMAPEQILANGVIDARTDVWGVGATLFRLLTRQYPFQEANPAMAVAAILTRAPARVQMLRPDVPDAVAALVDRCLSRDQAQRFQSVTELAFAIDRARMAPATPSQPFIPVPHSSPAAHSSSPASHSSPAISVRTSAPMLMRPVVPTPRAPHAPGAPGMPGMPSNAPLYVSIVLLALLLLGGGTAAVLLAKKRSAHVVPTAAAAPPTSADSHGR